MITMGETKEGQEEEPARESGDHQCGSEMELGKRACMAADDANAKVYPHPLLSHAEVSTSPAAFFDTLRRLHSDMGTRLMIPVIGGKELNLHQLYVQVTQRGGLEKVILERRWRDVIATFNFPSTTTSASFVLRKYYLSLLHHYEQVYFFRTQGPLVPPSAILQTKPQPSKPEQGGGQVGYEPTMRKKRAHPPRRNKVAPAPPLTIQGHASVSCDDAPRPPPAIASKPAAGNLNPPPASTPNVDAKGVAGTQNNYSPAKLKCSWKKEILLPDVNGVTGTAAVTAALPSETTRAGACKDTPKAHQRAASAEVTQAPPTVVSQPAAIPPNPVANGIAGPHSVPSAPTSGESTPTDRSAVSNADSTREATPSAPASVTPTFGETAQTGDHNLMVSGRIDGKFEHGYFVSVKVGSQTLHGVLYHVPPQAAAYPSPHQANQQPPAAPSVAAASPSNATDPYIPQTRSVQRRRKYKNRAPGHPKPNRSAYNFFFAEKHAKLKMQYPHMEREYSKMIGESWSKLTEEERRVYDEYGKRDKERYRKELLEYKERMRLVQPRGVLRIREPVNETKPREGGPNKKGS